MKQLILSLTLSIILAIQVIAGSMTITTDAGQDARLQAAFRSILSLDHNPNAAEMKSAVIAWLRQSVQDYERRQAQAAISPTPFDPN